MDISEAVAAFTPVLALTGTDLYLQNYSILAAILEAGKVSLDDVTVGIVIKQHSRAVVSHRSCTWDRESQTRILMPTLNRNRATSWRGMPVYDYGYFEFSLDNSGKIVIRFDTKEVSATDFANNYLIVNRGGFFHFQYAFMGAQFKIGNAETQYSSNSLVFTGKYGDGSSYLSSGWQL